MIFTRLCHCHLSVRVGDSSQHSKEIVKSRTAPLNAIIIIIIIINDRKATKEGCKTLFVAEYKRDNMIFRDLYSTYVVMLEVESLFFLSWVSVGSAVGLQFKSHSRHAFLGHRWD